MPICVLAEKPSQAKEFYRPLIEKLTGEKMREHGEYLANSTYTLSWFYGHLLSAIEPAEYDAKYQSWKMEDLPILPEKLRYKFKDEGATRRANVLKKLCTDASEVICATDPDREGEGIFRTFWESLGLATPVKRLWAVSLADEDLLKSWQCMKPASAYDALARARECRAAADWLVGMNASRAYSIVAYGKLPIGRVLTATLALIVARDREVESYREIFHYTLEGTWHGVKVTFFDEENGTKFDNKAMLDALRADLAAKTFSLAEFKDEARTEHPPKPYNLPELQKDGNRKHGFALDRTLELAQSLYEKKLVTYPRTDSQFLPESDLAKYAELLGVVATDEEKKLLLAADRKPPCVKDTDSAHTALIPTGVAPKNLSDDEAKLYELVRKRFAVAFMQPRKYRQYTLVVDDGAGHRLKGSATFDTDRGFKALWDEKPDEEEKEKEESGEKEQSSALKKTLDEKTLREAPSALEGLETYTRKKSKPKYYTAATLITAMQNCGNQLEDEQARKTLKEVRGIGTPATQATYPVHLEKYGYIRTEKKNFVSTPKGRSLIASIRPELASPVLTADWEFKLKEIEHGRYDAAQFDREIREHVSNVVAHVAANGRSEVRVITEKTVEPVLIPCPVCGRYLHAFDWGWACVRACGFKIGKTIAGKTLSSAEAEAIAVYGTTERIGGFTSKAGKPFSARVVLKGNDVGFDFTYQHPCPRCKGALDEDDDVLSCKSRCGFLLKKTVNGKALTSKQLEEIVTKGRSPLIKGFASKTGETFDAYIFLDANGKAHFEKKEEKKA